MRLTHPQREYLATLARLDRDQSLSFPVVRAASGGIGRYQTLIALRTLGLAESFGSFPRRWVATAAGRSENARLFQRRFMRAAS